MDEVSKNLPMNGDKLVFSSPEEVFGLNRLFFAKKNLLDLQLFSIKKSEITPRAVDVSVSGYEIYLPEEDEIFYILVGDDILILVGQQVSEESMGTLAGVIQKLYDEIRVCYFLRPELQAETLPDWYPSFKASVERTVEILQRIDDSRGSKKVAKKV